MDIEKFDDIRPYIDEEVSPALARIAANPLLVNIAAYLFPGKGVIILRTFCYHAIQPMTFR